MHFITVKKNSHLEVRIWFFIFAGAPLKGWFAAKPYLLGDEDAATYV